MASASLVVPVAVMVVAGGLLAVDDEAVDEALDAVTERFRSSVDDALLDVTLLPLDVVDAHGRTQGRALHTVSLTFRHDGGPPVALETLVALGPEGTPLEPQVRRVLRDDDGSVGNGTLDAADLVEVALGLPGPWDGRDPYRVRIVADGAQPAAWELRAPRNLAPDVVPLEASRRDG